MEQIKIDSNVKKYQIVDENDTELGVIQIDTTDFAFFTRVKSAEKSIKEKLQQFKDIIAAENIEFDKYKIPFFIWSNFTSEEKNMGLTSINFLSTMMLEEAGITMPPYYKFLAGVQKQIPAIHAYGYFDGNDYHKSNAVEIANNEVLNDYWLLQYANVFGDFKGSNLFN